MARSLARRARPAAVCLLLCLLCLMAARAEIHDELPCEDWYRRPLLRLTAFNTAQSDCLLLECGGQRMMVDGGSAPFRADMKAALEERGITHFKYHISGLYWLMRYGFSVDAYLHPYSDAAITVSERQAETIRQAEKSGIPAVQVFHGDELLLGEAVLTLYRYDDVENTNGRSLVTRVEFGDASLLLTADIIGETQRWMLQNLPSEALKADIVKAPHHGITPMVVEFLEAVAPQAVLITNDDSRVDKGRVQLAITSFSNVFVQGYINFFGSACMAGLITNDDSRVDKGRVQLESREIPAYYSGEGTVVFETDGEDWYIYQLEGRF